MQIQLAYEHQLGSVQSGFLLVGLGTTWFRLLPGPRIDLRRKRSTRLVLDALVARRLAHPGQAVPIDTLIEYGWPGETMRRSSATSRLYVTVLALRNLGLRGVLLGQDGGYLLDPDIFVSVATQGRPPG